MAKNRQNMRSKRVGRETTAFTKNPLLRPKKWPYSTRTESLWLREARLASEDLKNRGLYDDRLREIEDRRTWHPQGPQRAARSFNRPLHRLALPNTSNAYEDLFSPFKMARVAFDTPRNVLVCVRRKIRREVMHALGFAGSGSGSQKPRKYSEYSHISC